MVQFDRGELVRLRSGGPMMTVSAVKGDQIECIWTDDSANPTMPPSWPTCCRNSNRAVLQSSRRREC
ncbi:DUF2158 domain-containing protein [Bradyrhizobium sp. Bra64]|uniref:DUF2158 domain-containing protein n=1 Tax=Bradyrhizobium sp. Bra64 TaxID=2926009 RepID=UPI003565A762